MSKTKIRSTFILPILGMILIPFLTPLLGIGAGKCMGYHEPAMNALKNCPEARALLGEDISMAFMGMSCGSAKTEGSYGRVSWRMPVKGDQASGSYEIYAEKRGGPWKFRKALLKVGDEMVNVLSCRRVKRK